MWDCPVFHIDHNYVDVNGFLDFNGFHDPRGDKKYPLTMEKRGGW